ncbi:transglycosylase domain-containing protein [Micromonospora peucetia]|uniref:Membrane carboxypeptidase (Penicillin-binding protein) n=1 Tax=Micromonospora peucetia TaxID=47871 RepID=A0A1C6V1V2_9ACTN|nr:transglycosylase domain-containing protein [Micromonospora peucetia]MCX4389018.1 transglycosylase domain-containing protein [Micromonospora peucetia]WSA35225.1 transglycosylase domain-containing protein [Micromonospora peucetia]SCL60245.1 Membrane carboxypeptidase (penicillin-binding protein) [Micromonospora peucetia]
MRKRDHNVFTNAASLLICGLLAGVVVAAAAFPAVAMSGLAAKAGAETFGALPKELTVARAPQISYLYASDGKTPLATMYDENRRDVKLKDIAPIMQKAIVAAEDHDFYKHNGVDLNGIARAFVNNQSNAASQQGASTLTMQYVRLAIAYSASHPADVVAATEDTSARKLREMRYAIQIDKELSKDEILERYLNIAAFGNGAYGIYAASQVYFNKPPSKLKIEEAAMLAGMVKAPSSNDPTRPSGYKAAVDRRDYVIENMVETGAITRQEADAAKAVKLTVTGKRAPNGCVSANEKGWGFFCDYFYRWWMQQEAFGSTSYDRERRLKSGGYSVVTTLDPQAQRGADKAVRKAKKESAKEAAMVAVVEPGTGYVRALAVNRTFKLDDPKKPVNKPHSDPKLKKKKRLGNYPNTVNPLLTGGDGLTGYQAGSVFKIFTIVAALEKGIPLGYTINAPQQFKSEYRIQPGKAACPGTNLYCPTNSNMKAGGVQNMWSAFAQSVNTYFVPLQQQVGAENVVDAAKRLGIQFRTSEDLRLSGTKDAAHDWGAFTLGVSQTTPLDLANAYATLAADGKYCEPIPVQSIKDPEGKKLDIANPRCEKRVSTEVARAAVDAARCPVGDNSSTSKCGGSRTAGNVRGIVDAPVAGKSGTTDSEKTASLVAMTKQYAVAGIMADPDWPQTNVKMKHKERDGINPPVYETLRDAMKGKPRINFTPPGQKISEGDQRRIPVVKCLDPQQAKSRIKAEGFDAIISDVQVPSSCPAGKAAGTSPDGRTIKGGVVTIQISAGGGEPGGPGSPPTNPGRPPSRPGG